MKVAVIGTHWGRVHVGAFRGHGHEVVALVGRDQGETERVARDEGIPRACVNLDEVEDAEIVVVASPTGVHRRHVERFLDRPVLCEKPLCGFPLDRAFIQRAAAAQVFVNYAFPFLDTAREARRRIEAGELGEVFRVLVDVPFHFERELPAREWFLDLVSHPLSFLNAVFGAFGLVQWHEAPGRTSVSAVMANGAQTLDLALYRAPRECFRVGMTLVGDRAVMRLEGGYEPATRWSFQPLLVDGKPVTEGERSGAEDVWIRANHRAVGAFLDVVLGRTSREDAGRCGLQGAALAAQVELGLEPMFTDEAP
jgi:myo-inositol 2-dehydrogenase / D-chiro-inositol 1-dehydrogenase